MTTTGVFVPFVGMAIAYANGSNDVSKGVATLVGSGVTDYRRAIAWGTVWTAVSGLASALIAGAMITTFGNGFLAHAAALPLSVPIGALAGAALWVLVSTRLGLPVSTTHASFARGANDAPKMVALVLAAGALAPAAHVRPILAFVLVASSMALGSWVAGRRVTQLLAEKVTPLDHREGFTANLFTAVLVTSGAVFGLPMSTTHVASGGIVGASADRGGSALNRHTVRDMAVAWVVTLPGAAALGVVAYGIARLAA